MRANARKVNGPAGLPPQRRRTPIRRRAFADRPARAGVLPVSHTATLIGTCKREPTHAATIGLEETATVFAPSMINSSIITIPIKLTTVAHGLSRRESDSYI